MNIKLLAATAAGALTLALSAPASAVIFTGVGQTSVTDFNGFFDSTVIPGLSAEITYTLTGLSGNTATFSYIVDNTSSAPVTASRITTFGFNIDPNFTSVGTVTGAVFPNVSSGNIPNALPNVEFCLTSGPNCSGGAGGGVLISDPNATGSFTFNFAAPPTTISLTDLYVRYQSITAPGITDGSATGIPVGNPIPNPIPEPATWAMMILGFGGIGAMLRRRRALVAI